MMTTLTFMKFQDFMDSMYVKITDHIEVADDTGRPVSIETRSKIKRIRLIPQEYGAAVDPETGKTKRIVLRGSFENGSFRKEEVERIHGLLLSEFPDLTLEAVRIGLKI